MRKSLFPLFVGLVAISLLTNCSVKKDLDTMLESTETLVETSGQINENSEEIKEESKEIKEVSTEIKDRTQDLFIGSIEAFGEQVMNERFEKLKKAKTTAEKVSHAVVIFAAMDYQHWQGDHDHNTEIRDYLIEKNVDYFFNNLKRFPTDGNPINPKVHRPRQFDNWKSLGALAVAMSKVHPNQERIAKVLGFEPLSLFDILANSLKSKVAHENGKEVPHYVSKVLENESTAKYLLQLRHNFFKGVMLTAISDYEEGRADGIWNKVWYGYLSRSLKVEVSQFNKAEYKKWSTDWLWKIAVTQHTLKNLGIPLQETSIITQAFNKVVFTDGQQPLNMKPFKDQEIDLLDNEMQGLNEKENFFARFIRLQN